MKPTIKEVEEYMAALNLPEEKFNGTTVSDFNVISKPKHYMLFEEEGIEVRDVIGQLLKKVQDGDQTTTPYYKEARFFESDYVQLMQYLMRFMDKNGKEDLEKARVYLNWMIEAYE